MTTPYYPSMRPPWSHFFAPVRDFQTDGWRTWRHRHWWAIRLWFRWWFPVPLVFRTLTYFGWWHKDEGESYWDGHFSLPWREERFWAQRYNYFTWIRW